MKYMQNKIIIALLVIIASGIGYFVTQDIMEKSAAKNLLDKAKIEREEYKTNRKARDERYDKRRKSKRKYPDSMFHKHFNK